VNAAEPQRQLASALGRVASGLFILTARGQDAETGMLVSWVQQCSMQPPRVSVCVQNGRAILDWLTNGADFVLNILDDSQTDMISHFGRGFLRGAAAFENVEVDCAAASAPVLTEALAYLDCRVVSRCPAGDHELLIADVRAG
jgi:flavin reductase (DIM6/NTAB) family NADH-FMN oxidoreductase RutF